MKKWTSLLLALALILGYMPLSARAAEESGYKAMPPEEAGCSESEWEVLKLTNLVRWEEARLDPLTTYATLQEAAGIRAEELTESFSHTRPDGSSWSSAGESLGLDMLFNENIAAGYGSPAAVVNGWRNSPGHYNGMMGAWASHFTNPEGVWSRVEGYGYTMHLGVGECEGRYWAQNFQGENPYSGAICAEINGYDSDEEAIADHLKNNTLLCAYTALELSAPEGEIPSDVPIQDMGIVGVLTCRRHGECYFPVLAEYCSGYDPDVVGAQTITVSVCGFEASCTVTTTAACETVSAEADFADVDDDDYYHDAVLWAVEQGITSGTGENTFSPGAACTRAQVVTFLWRAAGSPEPSGGENPFSDVAENAYYRKAVLWAVEQGITSGTGENTFSPGAVCTRGQIVTFLWRYAGSPEPEGAADFADVSGSAYYARAVAWAVEQGVTSGVGNGRFGPGQVCTRAQVVTFLWRASDSPAAGEVVNHIHSWQEEVIAPLCAGCGYTRRICSDCGVYTLVSGSFTEPLGHEYETHVVEPTEEDTGYTEHLCTRCGNSRMEFDQ